MGTWDGLHIGQRGMGFAKYWLDTLAHNIANVNEVRPTDEEPFRARLVVAAELRDRFTAKGAGIAVRGIVEDQGDPTQVYDPDNPLADDEGYVLSPVVDLAQNMTNLLIANRTYGINARAIHSAREAYQSALRIGQS